MFFIGKLMREIALVFHKNIVTLHFKISNMPEQQD